MTKNAVVTGGTDGIGKGLVLALGAQDYTVLTIGRSIDKLKVLEKEFAELGKGKLLTQAGDLTKDTDLQTFTGLVTKTFMQLDVLVNNAGFQIGNALLKDADPKLLAQMFAIHVTVPLKLYKTVYPLMCAPRFGTIINIVSIVVKNYLKETYGPYTISKYGEYGLGNMMVKEASKDNIKVTNVILGGAETNIRPGSRPTYLQPKEVGSVLMGVINAPEATFITEIHIWPQVQLS